MCRIKVQAPKQTYVNVTARTTSNDFHVRPNTMSTQTSLINV